MFNLDIAPIDENNAAFLMWYHLRMAVTFYEALPGDIKIHKANFQKRFFSSEINDPLIESGAGVAFMDSLTIWHQENNDES